MTTVGPTPDPPTGLRASPGAGHVPSPPRTPQTHRDHCTVGSPQVSLCVRCFVQPSVLLAATAVDASCSHLTDERRGAGSRGLGTSLRPGRPRRAGRPPCSQAPFCCVQRGITGRDGRRETFGTIFGHGRVSGRSGGAWQPWFVLVPSVPICYHGPPRCCNEWPVALQSPGLVSTELNSG